MQLLGGRVKPSGDLRQASLVFLASVIEVSDFPPFLCQSRLQLSNLVQQRSRGRRTLTTKVLFELLEREMRKRLVDKAEDPLEVSAGPFHRSLVAVRSVVLSDVE